MVLEGAITLPAADVPEPFVDAQDIADVAIAALTEKGHDHEIYEFTGPRLLTFTDAARQISEAAGRNIRSCVDSARGVRASRRQIGRTGMVVELSLRVCT